MPTEFTRHGGTLVEVMIACLVIMTIAMAGGAFVYRSQGTLSLHRDRSVAFAVATSRLEELRASSFGTLTNLVAGQASGTNVVWVKWNGAAWQPVAATDYEPVMVGAFQELLRTGLQRVNVVPSSGQYEALLMTARMTCRQQDLVELTTLYAP